MERPVIDPACAAARDAIDRFFIVPISSTHPDKLLLLDHFLSHVFDVASGQRQCEGCAQHGATWLLCARAPPVSNT